MGRRTGFKAAVVFGALALAACERPSWTDPAKSRDQRDLPAAPPAPLATSPDPAPAPPAWAAGLIGRPLRSAFARTDVCVGRGQAVRRFDGQPQGAEASGWGWDVRAGRPVGRVLLVDKAMIIAGAGEGGRPYVAPADRESDPRAAHAGWLADTAAADGALRVFGVTRPGVAVCPLGQVRLG